MCVQSKIIYYIFQHDSLLDKIKELSTSNVSESEEEKCDSIRTPQCQSTPKPFINIGSPIINEDNNNLVAPKKTRFIVAKFSISLFSD